MADSTVDFSLRDITTNQSSFVTRCAHFLNVTNPMFFMYSDSQIQDAVKTVKTATAACEASENGVIKMSTTEKANVILSKKIMNSNCND